MTKERTEYIAWTIPCFRHVHPLNSSAWTQERALLLGHWKEFFLCDWLLEAQAVAALLVRARMWV